MMKDLNEVILRGSVLTLNVTRKNASIRLAVETERGITNFPLIQIYDVNLVNGIKISDRIKIKGHTQKRAELSKDGKRVTKTIIVADDIKISTRRLHDYFNKDDIEGEDGGVAADLNYALVVGDVHNIHIPEGHNGELCIVRIEIKDSDIPRQCDFSCFGRQANFCCMLEKGQKVAIVGYVSTQVKKKEKETLYFQNMICKDIALVKQQ